MELAGARSETLSRAIKYERVALDELAAWEDLAQKNPDHEAYAHFCREALNHLQDAAVAARDSDPDGNSQSRDSASAQELAALKELAAWGELVRAHPDTKKYADSYREVLNDLKVAAAAARNSE